MSDFGSGSEGGPGVECSGTSSERDVILPGTPTRRCLRVTVELCDVAANGASRRITRRMTEEPLEADTLEQVAPFMWSAGRLSAENIVGMLVKNVMRGDLILIQQRLREETEWWLELMAWNEANPYEGPIVFDTVQVQWAGTGGDPMVTLVCDEQRRGERVSNGERLVTAWLGSNGCQTHEEANALGHMFLAESHMQDSFPIIPPHLEKGRWIQKWRERHRE